MGSDLYVSLSGALARLRELDVVANNLANADTVGFKRDRVAFTEALAAARAGADPARVFAEAAPGGIDFSAGPVAPTGSPLDVAIAGPGFFEVATQEGPRFTRAGAFLVNADGVLSTPAGHPVLGEGGPIAVGDRAVSIRSTGEVVDAAERVVGTLRVVAFEDERALVKEGDDLLRTVDGASPEPVEGFELVERSLERANVRAAEELSALILLQRHFEIAMRALQSDDEATGQLIREVLA